MKRALFCSLSLCLCLFPLLGDASDPLNLDGPPVPVKKEKISTRQKQLAKQLKEIEGLLIPRGDREQNKEALNRLGSFIESHSDYGDAYFIRAMAYLQLPREKDYQRIIKDLDQAIKFSSSDKYVSMEGWKAHLLSLRAKAYKEIGNYAQAMKDLEEAIILDATRAISHAGTKPDEPEPGMWGKKDFEEFIQKYPNECRGYLFIGIFYLHYGIFGIGMPSAYDLAIENLIKAITLNNKSAISYYELGEAYYSKMISKVSFGVKTKEDYQEEARLVASGQTIWEAHPMDYKNIINALTTAIELNNSMVKAYRERANLYICTKQYKLANYDLDKVILLDPDSGDAYYARGMVKQQLGNYYDAIDDFSNAIEAKKQLFTPYIAYVNRADAYISLNEYEKAIEDYTKAIELKIADGICPSVTRLRYIYPEYNKLNVFSLSKKIHHKFYSGIDYDSFYKWLTREKESHWGGSFDSHIYEDRGDSYLQCGYLRKAYDDYNRAIRISPTYPIDRWKLCLTTSNLNYYFDIKTVEIAPKGSIKFWMKRESKTNEPGEPKETIENWSINCSLKKINVLSFVKYDAEGNVVASGDYPSGWTNVIPGSVGEALCSGWCH